MSSSIAHGSEDSISPAATTKKTSSLPLLSSIDPETIRVYVMSVLTRVRGKVTMDTLRPLPMFLGLSGPALCISAGAFNPPVRKMDKSFIEKIRARIGLNMAFFMTNYALVTFGVAIVVALSHPGMLLFMGLVYCLWWGHSYLINHEIVIGGTNLSTVLSISQRTTVLSVVTAIVIVWKCLVPVVSFVAISGLLVLCHACLRDPNHIENTGDLLGDDEDDDEHNRGVGGPRSSTSDSGVMVERGDVI